MSAMVTLRSGRIGFQVHAGPQFALMRVIIKRGASSEVVTFRKAFRGSRGSGRLLDMALNQAKEQR